jgi:hypothetical protein
VDDEHQPSQPKRRQPEFRAERPEPPAPVGGTLTTPDHPRTRFDRIPRIVKLGLAGVAGLLTLGLVLWGANELGWRRGLALVGSTLLLVGLLTLRVGRPSEDFLEGVRKEQRRAGLPVTSLDELRQGQTAFRFTVTATCLALGLTAVALAIWGP